MEMVDIAEFMDRTWGGRPNQMDMSAYLGADYECGCGETHAWTPDIPVLRELKAMRLVIGCPRGVATNCVKIKGIFRFKGFKTLFAACDEE